MNSPRNGHSADEPLLGNREPRILLAPPAVSSAAAEAIELAAYCGLELDPWQQLVLDYTLRERDDGKWSAFEVGLCVPRQNGKSKVIEARILAGIMLFDEELVTYSAHEFKTAMEIMRRLEELLRNSGEKFMAATSHGQEGFEMGSKKRQGRRIMFQSRTKSSGLGLSGDCVILDEAMWLHEDAIGVLMPTMATRENPQIWYAGSSVDQEMHPKGFVFSGVRKRGIERTSARLCYLEWSPPDDGVERGNPRTWAMSNPSFGYRISEEFIAAEFEAMQYTPKKFDVMRLGIGDWPTLADILKPPIDVDQWVAAANTQPQPIDPAPRVIAVDRSPLSKVWSICGAQYTESGKVHVEIGLNQSGSPTEIVEKLMDIVTDADPAAVIIDARSPSAVLIPLLLEAGIEAVTTNQPELAIACEGFLEAAAAGQISHVGQQFLTESVGAAIKKDLPGGRFTWESAAGGSIVHLVAATLAHWGLLMHGRPPKRSAPPMSDKPEVSENDRRSGRDFDDFDPMSAPF